MKNCSDCGATHGSTIFLWVGDDLWKKMGCKKEDYLCAHCVVIRLQSVTSYIYATDGRQKTAIIGPARLAIATQELA